ncbi:hypothetical protein ACTWLT_09325 [Micromonospora sp. ZYX-F-536]|uniref:hypothetical protein n=1 Tax=Micromonospora sp. ZYX-F-536 TaxID=3457629 RepID=UPI00404083DB
MAHLSVRTQAMPDANPFASPVVFDFTADIDSGEQILAYAVAMSGFVLNYQTNSAWWAEDAGAVGVSLTPNLIGTVVAVGGNVMLTDYDGDSAIDPPNSDSGPGSVAQVSVLAVIGTPYTSAPVCATAFGLTSGQDSSVVPIGDNTTSLAFLSGFSVAASDGTGEIGGLTLASSVASPVGNQVTVNGSVGLTNFSTTGTVDVGLLSYGADLVGFDVQAASVTWLLPEGQQGMTGVFFVDFTIPSGYSSVAQAALLLQDVSIVYDDTAEFQLIQVMQAGDLSINACTVSGSVVLNLFNPDTGAHHYICGDSSATLSVIAQFA